MAKPRILIYDIESSPLITYNWTRWSDHGVIDVKQEWFLLCVTWKWLGESGVNYCGLNSFKSAFKNDPTDDIRLAQKIHALFEEADVTIAHNNDKFDKRKSNARFLLNGLSPPSPYKTIDTLKVARRHFALSSNSLNELTKMLGFGEKAKHPGFSMWRGCMQGCEKSWAQMERYAKKDVVLLEKIYKKLLPWIDNHPNYGLYSNTDEPTCTNCGSLKLIKRGTSYAYTQAYQRYQCTACGKYSKSTKSMKSVKIK